MNNRAPYSAASAPSARSIPAGASGALPAAAGVPLQETTGSTSLKQTGVVATAFGTGKRISASNPGSDADALASHATALYAAPAAADRDAAVPAPDAARLASAAAAPTPSTDAASASPALDTVNGGIRTDDPPDRQGQVPKSSVRGVPSDVPDALAFAARVQPQETTSSPLLSQTSAATPAFWTRKPSSASIPGQDAGAAASSNATPVLAQNTAAYSRNGDAASASRSLPASAPAEPAQASGHDADAASKPAAPVKDIVMRISQPGAQSVDVQVSQRAGEVRVAVRTGDAALAHGLRQGLTDLTGRLEDSGYRAETWRPASVVTAPERISETREPAGGANGSGTHSQSGSSQQESDRRNHNQQNQPRWVRDLEESLTSGGSSGDFHGFGN